MKPAMHLLLLGALLATRGAVARPPGTRDVERFNAALATATRSMDNAATLALWDADGVSLLPSTAPILGKPAIARFLGEVKAKYPGGRMRQFDLQCHDIRVSGRWASEWCTEHQLVQFPGDNPPFDGWGKMLLVLHRDAHGQWRLHEEMWNQAIAGTH